jgi:hypothetical protein
VLPDRLVNKAQIDHPVELAEIMILGNERFQGREEHHALLTSLAFCLHNHNQQCSTPRKQTFSTRPLRWGPFILKSSPAFEVASSQIPYFTTHLNILPARLEGKGYVDSEVRSKVASPQGYTAVSPWTKSLPAHRANKYALFQIASSTSAASTRCAHHYDVNKSSFTLNFDYVTH